MNLMTRQEHIASLERIANAMMTGGKLTLADPDTLLKIAHDLRTPDENAKDASRTLRAMNTMAQQNAARENGRKGGRPRKSTASS